MTIVNIHTGEKIGNVGLRGTKMYDHYRPLKKYAKWLFERPARWWVQNGYWCKGVRRYYTCLSIGPLVIRWNTDIDAKKMYSNRKGHCCDVKPSENIKASYRDHNERLKHIGII